MGEEYKSLLEKFSELNFGDGKSPTLLEIFGNRDRETLWSRYLTFFLNPNNEHGLKDFVLKSFLKVCGIETEYKIENVKVFAEYQYIDILIHLDNCVIGIENKVNAELYNDLHLYKTRLIDFAKQYGISRTEIIVLSKNHIPEKEDCYKYVTYDIFVAELKSQFFSYFKAANTKYLIFLLDFIENIEKSISMPTIITNPENLKFFKENYTKINDLLNKNSEYNKELGNLMSEIVSRINEKLYSNNNKLNQIFTYSTVTIWPEDDTWYITTQVSKNDITLFKFQFNFSKSEKDIFWYFYIKDEPGVEKKILKINDTIPESEHYLKIKNSVDTENIAEGFICLLNEILDKYSSIEKIQP